MGDDEALLDVVTSANVACGFHAGDPVTMLRTCRAAAAHDVTVGAHPSYPDLVGFGPRHLEMSAEELTAVTVYQVGALDACCRAAGMRLAYVKPHGALYHDVSCDAALARAFLLGVVEVAPLAVLGPAGSELLIAAAELGLRTASEVFADRGYRPDGSLVPRGESGAIVDDADAVAERVVAMVTRPYGRSTARSYGSSPTRSASIRTRRVRSRWPGGCARRWRAKASSSARSHEAAAERRARGTRRARRSGRGAGAG